MADIANTLIASIAILLGGQSNIPMSEVTTRFEASCTQGQWQAECPTWRARLETQLYHDLHELYLMGAPLDRKQLHLGTRSSFPYLAHFALSRIDKIQSPEDKEAVWAALEHPSPAVRLKAKLIVDRSGDEWREGVGRWCHSGSAEMTPSLQVDFGISELADPQLHYRYSASGERRAVYTTKLSPQKVLDLIAKDEPVVTGDQLGAGSVQNREQLDNSQQDMMEISKQMQEAAARHDMKTMKQLADRLKILQKGIQQSSKHMMDTQGMTPVTEFRTNPSQVQYAIPFQNLT